MNRYGSAFVLAIAALSTTVWSAAQDSRSTDEQAIQQILRDWVDSWNSHDMRRMANLYSEDADFVVITAQHLRGREEIFKYHDDLHKGLFKDSQRKAKWTDLKFLRPDVSVGHVYFEPPNQNATDRNSRTALALVVMTKEKGKWWITSFQNTLKYGPALPQQYPAN